MTPQPDAIESADEFAIHIWSVRNSSTMHAHRDLVVLTERRDAAIEAKARADERARVIALIAERIRLLIQTSSEVKADDIERSVRLHAAAMQISHLRADIEALATERDEPHVEARETASGEK